MTLRALILTNLGEQILSFGLQAGVTQYRTNNGDLNVYDPDAPEFAGSPTLVKPSFGAGVILSNDRYFVGLSVPRMLKHTDFAGQDVQLYQQHFYFTGAYTAFLSDRVRIKPSVLIRGVKGAPVSADYNVLFNIDEKYGAGCYTRNFNAFGFLAQLHPGNRYRLGYAFEVPSNKSIGTRYTSHELTLSVNLETFSFHDASVISSF